MAWSVPGQWWGSLLSPGYRNFEEPAFNPPVSCTFSEVSPVIAELKGLNRGLCAWLSWHSKSSLAKGKVLARDLLLAKELLPGSWR